MKNKILTITLFLISSICLGQKKITWVDLSKVKFTEKFFPAYDQSFLEPTFSESVKNLEGKIVSIKGYFLNIAPEDKIFILSKGPWASCFFCGVGGPETAIELQFKSAPNFKTDDIVTITGKLKLNADDVEHFNYILTGCKGKLLN